MKKLVISAAIAAAAALSTGVHAQPVTSNITGVALQVSGIPIDVPCTGTGAFTTGAALTGIGLGPGEINLTGHVCLDPNGTGAPLVAVVFALHGKQITDGTVFNNGYVDVYVDGDGTGTGTGYVHYDRVDASILSKYIYCVDPGGTDGIQWATPPATNTLSGVSCQTTLFGLTSDLILTGTNTF